MISILTQERILGAALGGGFVGTFVFQQRIGIYRSISGDKPAPLPKEELHGIKFFTDLPHLWNKAVDGTMGPVITYLSSRGCISCCLIIVGTIFFLAWYSEFITVPLICGDNLVI